MKFEVHKCTINHLKQKLLKHESADDDDDISVNELDLGHFKTVDSVGDVDGEEGKIVMRDCAGRLTNTRFDSSRKRN